MSRMKNLITRFHKDDRGSNSLEQVVIFALGILVLGGSWYVWNSLQFGTSKEKGIWGWLKETVGNVFTWALPTK